MKNNYVLDACALLAFLKDEDGADIIENLFRESYDIENIFLHKLNLLEIYYGILKYDGIVKADEMMQLIIELPIIIIDKINKNIFKKAGYYKANYRISLADAIALGTASEKKAKLITSDHHEFDIIEEKEGFKFLWIR
jgi:uncharacterized protein